ncbi:MAG: DnaB-like helicase C-terminal domain-containing protein, partial [Desulfovibrio sp.]|nr:DnaB-like helicase C-terminal domain-containing protein [Desulfovibrio sp.]
DVVMLLHRARRRSGDYSRVDVHVDKVRHGRPGTVHLLCHGPCTTMYDVCLSGTDGNGFGGPDAEGTSDGWNGDLPAFVPNNAGQARPLPLQGGFHAEF